MEQHPAQTFDLISTLGEGSTATVYLARERGSTREVALKLFPEAVLRDRAFLRKLRAETRAAQRVDSQRVVRCSGLTIVGGRPGIIMERVHGITLTELLTRSPHLSHRRVIEILVGVAEALADLHHAGLVHGDLKAGNIVVNAEGQITLIDLGHVKPAQPASVTRVVSADRSLDGTPMALAPELFTGELYNKSCDVYAFGVLAYELIAGEAPFSTTSLSELLRLKTTTRALDLQTTSADCPKSLAEFVADCTALDAKDRPKDGLEVLSALVCIAHELEVPIKIVPRDLPSDVPMRRWAEQLLAFTDTLLPVEQLLAQTPLERGLMRVVARIEHWSIWTALTFTLPVITALLCGVIWLLSSWPRPVNAIFSSSEDAEILTPLDSSIPEAEITKTLPVQLTVARSGGKGYVRFAPDARYGFAINSSELKQNWPKGALEFAQVDSQNRVWGNGEKIYKVSDTEGTSTIVPAGKNFHLAYLPAHQAVGYTTDRFWPGSDICLTSLIAPYAETCVLSGDQEFDWVADGPEGSLLFTTPIDGATELMKRDSSGAITQLTALHGRVRKPHLVGEQIIFLGRSSKDSPFQLYTLSSTGDVSVLVELASGIEDYVINP